ncbi:chemotaxis protein CheW [Bacillaceae bacterium W0354]
MISLTGNSKYIVFRMRDEQFAVNIDQVDAIERVSDFTKVPQAPDFMKGIVELRGDIISVVDLRQLLDIGETDLNHDPRIIIVNVQDLKIGLLVDEAKEVIDLDDSIIEEPPKMIGGVKKEYIHGVARLEDRLLIVMNLMNVLQMSDVEQIKAVK